MKRYALITFILLAVSTIASDLTYILIGATDTLFATDGFRRNVLLALEYAKGDPLVAGDAAATNAWFESNFADGYVYAPNTNIGVRVYCNSLKNIARDTWPGISAADRQTIKEKAEQTAQVQIALTQDPSARLAEWQVVREETEEP